MGDRCLLQHIEEQRALLFELVNRVHISPTGEAADIFAEETGKLEDTTREGESLIELRPGGLFNGGLKLATSIGSKIQQRVVSSQAILKVPETEGPVVNDEESAARIVGHLERLSSQWMVSFDSKIRMLSLLQLILYAVKCLGTECASRECLRPCHGLLARRRP